MQQDAFLVFFIDVSPSFFFFIYLFTKNLYKYHFFGFCLEWKTISSFFISTKTRRDMLVFTEEFLTHTPTTTKSISMKKMKTKNMFFISFRFSTEFSESMYVCMLYISGKKLLIQWWICFYFYYYFF